MNLSNLEVYKSTEIMKERFNIGTSDGLREIAEDLQLLLKKD